MLYTSHVNSPISCPRLVTFDNAKALLSRSRSLGVLKAKLPTLVSTFTSHKMLDTFLKHLDTEGTFRPDRILQIAERFSRELMRLNYRV